MRPAHPRAPSPRERECPGPPRPLRRSRLPHLGVWPERAYIGALRRPLPPGTTAASDRAAGRRRPRPTVGGRPDSNRQRAASACGHDERGWGPARAKKVLIAAILHPAIRVTRTKAGGACRAPTLLKPADDRRGSGTGTNRRGAFRRPTRLAATDAVRQPDRDDRSRRSPLLPIPPISPTVGRGSASPPTP